MTAYIIDIVRFALCVIFTALAVIVMIKADDNHVLRFVTAGLAAAVIWRNAELGRAVSLLIGSVIETVVAAMGAGFILILGAVIMLLPIAGLVRWVLSGLTLFKGGEK